MVNGRLIIATAAALMAAAPGASALVDAVEEAPADEVAVDEAGVVAGDGATFQDAITAAKAAMMGAPQTAYENGLAAEKLAASAAASDALATSLWLQAEALTRLNRAEDARAVVERAFAALKDASSKLAGDLMVARGRIARVLGEDGSALENFQSAYRIYNSLGERRSEAIALQSVGTVYQNARQYERVIEYYARASEAFSDDAMLDMVSLNNRANAMRELERHDEARALFDEALQIARTMGSDLLQARILTNIAVLETRRGAFDEADLALTEGFAKLSTGEARAWAPFLWGARGQLSFAKGDLEAAKDAIERAFADKPLEETTAPFRDFHETAYQIYEALGEPTRALGHLKSFKRLDDHGRDVAASANHALMTAEFDLASKELEIQRLRSAQLEKDVALTQSRKRQGDLVAIGATLSLLSVLGFLTWAYRAARRENRMTLAFNAELGAKNAELTDANRALEKANQAKMEFLATTSHEIRTPLNAVIGLTDVVLNGDALVERDREYLKIVASSGANLLRIVNDILDIAKLESGRLIVERRPLDVAECLLDVAGLWRKSAEEKGLQYDVDVDPGLAAYQTDERLIRQIASNLLSNAIKFTPEGRISLALKALPEGGFSISVADTGIGIAEDQFTRIFESFAQVDGGARRAYEGTGLGLAVCRKIADALGGDIRVESAPGEGSTFTVTIPAEPSRDLPCRPAAA